MWLETDYVNEHILHYSIQYLEISRIGKVIELDRHC